MIFEEKLKDARVALVGSVGDGIKEKLE